MKVVRITQEENEQGGLILRSFNEIASQLMDVNENEVGDKYVLHIEEMSEEDFKNLPEWDGF